ncbi:MAG: ribosome-associated translation inhibitor RaiA [Saprospiraceae bacterium]|nr:ribosome-associated translation inhibitor RaiA [Saprospiraceae bacterium]MDW8228415.1 ribosome-associated translation inhibitor RaiA [Saprospiraceae bacterium]
MNINVRTLHCQADERLVKYIHLKLQRLHKIYHRIEGVDVRLMEEKKGGKVAEVQMHVPGGWLIDRKSSTTFESAINASMDTLRRQLARYKDKRYGYEPEKATALNPHE